VGTCSSSSAGSEAHIIRSLCAFSCRKDGSFILLGRIQLALCVQPIKNTQEEGQD
jgi:hypothetical protein